MGFSPGLERPSSGCGAELGDGSQPFAQPHEQPGCATCPPSCSPVPENPKTGARVARRGVPPSARLCSAVPPGSAAPQRAGGQLCPHLQGCGSELLGGSADPKGKG